MSAAARRRRTAFRVAGVLAVVVLVWAGSAVRAAGHPSVRSATGSTGPSGATGATGSPGPSPPHKAETVTLQWVGDIAFGIAYGLPPGGPTGAMGGVRRELHAAQLTLGNLEGTLSLSGGSKCAGAGSGSCFAFRAPSGYAPGFRDAGFSVMNMANNHTWDSGPGGQRATVAALDRAGVGHTGRPGEITIRKVGGLRVAFLGFAPYASSSNLLDISAATALVRRARRSADLVVVFIHAGAEGVGHMHVPFGAETYLGENRGDARRFAHAAIDAGASIVLGSGPHVIRGIERYRNRMIAYSLGNFAGYNTLSLGGPLSESAILRVTLDATGRVLSGRWIAVRLVPPGLPRLDPSRASTQLVAGLSRSDFPTSRYPIGADGEIRGCADARYVPALICRRLPSR